MDDRGIHAVAGTEIVLYDTGLKEIGFRFCIGSGRRAWQHLAEDIIAWAKSQGCTVGAGPFRKGWKAILQGWVHTHDYLERVL